MNSNTNPFLSVVIPCFNEENNLKNGCLDGVINYFKTAEFSSEILVVDDASTDKSVELLKKYENKNEIKIIKKQHSYKAGTIIVGSFRAKGKYILFSDMDQATPISEFDKFLPYLKKNENIIIGSRKDERRGAPLSRKIMAKGFIILRSLILGLYGIKDTQCGFKVFKKDVAERIFNKLILYKTTSEGSKISKVTAGFDVEVLYIARILGYKIIEIPVIWNYVETRRVNPIRDSIEGLIDMLKIKFNGILKKYD